MLMQESDPGLVSAFSYDQKSQRGHSFLTLKRKHRGRGKGMIEAVHQHDVGSETLKRELKGSAKGT